MRGGFFFGSAAPVVPNDNYRLTVQLRKAPDDCRIVAAPSVSVKLQEASSHVSNVESRRRTPRVSRQSYLLPRWEPLAFHIGRQTLCSCVRGSLFPQMAN